MLIMVNACFRCFQEFKRKDYLDKHLQRKSKCKMIHKCIECDKTFYDKSTLNKHYISEIHKISKENYIEPEPEKIIKNGVIVGQKIPVDVKNYLEVLYPETGDPVDIFKKTHYNTGNEENMNIYINNARTNNIRILENGLWVEKNKVFVNEIIGKLPKNNDKKLRKKLLDLMHENKYLFNISLGSEKRSEDRVCELLLENNIDFERNYSIKNKKFRAFVDFLIETPEFYIILECDENGHECYDEDCEEFRIFKIKKLLDKDSIVIRYNPNDKYNCEETLIKILKDIIENNNTTLNYIEI